MYDIHTSFKYAQLTERRYRLVGNPVFNPLHKNIIVPYPSGCGKRGLVTFVGFDLYKVNLTLRLPFCAQHTIKHFLKELPFPTLPRPSREDDTLTMALDVSKIRFERVFTIKRMFDHLVRENIPETACAAFGTDKPTLSPHPSFP